MNNKHRGDLKKPTIVIPSVNKATEICMKNAVVMVLRLANVFVVNTAMVLPAMPEYSLSACT